MANICANYLHAYSNDADNIKTVSEFFDDRNDYVVTTEDSVDVDFNSNWIFPEEKMNDLYKKIPNKEDIYMTCLSVEYGNLYHELWICDENGWRDV